MVGTGGIGSGSFFQVSGNETLGREESRAGRFLDRRDFCKLHIISHYVKVLMGDNISVFPVGRVGNDTAGARLLREMAEVGMDMRFARTLDGVPTLFSFCLLYPDGSGGNLTTEDSASSRLGPDDVAEADEVMQGLGGRGIALAAPEVPLPARVALLRAASRHGLFRAASFTRAEMGQAVRSGFFDIVDLLAVNAGELFAAAGLPEGPADPGVVEQAVAAVSARHPRLMLSVTAGRGGSWSWDGNALRYCAARKVEALGTAGAGDAHLAGILCGLASGLALAAAQELGTILAGASVQSPDTINRQIDASTLLTVRGAGDPVSAQVQALLDSAMTAS